MKKIAIVIPIYNRLEITKSGLLNIHLALLNVKENSQFNFDVIIVDDGSDDGSSEWIKENYPAIKILRGDGNLWWTGSVDLGSRVAVNELGYDYVLLWNDDTICNQDYFEELINILNQSFYNNKILVSKVLWQDERDVIFNFGCYFDSKNGKKILNGSNEVDSDKYNNIIKVDWSGGMGTLIPKEVLKSIDFFDPKNFPQYHGDSDMFLRAKKNGFETFAIPTLKIYNNKDTSGIKRIKNFKDLKNYFTSNRSNYNFNQNVFFCKRHTIGAMAWINFSKYYLKAFLISIK